MIRLHTVKKIFKSLIMGLVCLGILFGFILCLAFLLSIPGRDIWAGVVAYELFNHGVNGQATINNELYVQPSISSINQRNLYIFEVQFKNHTRSFIWYTPPQTKKNKISVRYLKEQPEIFVPHGKDTGYWDMVTSLAAITAKVGVSDLIGHLLLFTMFVVAVPLTLYKGYRKVGLPLLKLFLSWMNDQIQKVLSRFIPLASKIQNILFKLTLLAILALAEVLLFKVFFRITMHLDSTLAAVVTGVYVYVGVVVLLAAVQVITRFRKESLFPELQEMIAKAVTVLALFGVLRVCTLGIATGGDTDVIRHLVKVVKIIFGWN